MHDKVDVLIIGSGASGAAVAWSLADTRMRILCLEQGDWMKPTDYPEQRAGLGGAPVQRLRHQPQSPRARDRLSDQRRQLADQGGELQRRRRQHHHVHRALPAPASVGLQGEHARRRGRRLAGRLRHAGALLRRERPHDGRLGPRRRSGLSAPPAADAAAAARQVGRALRPGDEQARLALVAVRLDDRHDRLRGPRALHQSRPLHAGLRAGRQGQHRHHLLAGGHPRRGRAAHALPGARDHRPTSTAWRRAWSTTTPTARSSSSRPKS